MYSRHNVSGTLLNGHLPQSDATAAVRKDLANQPQRGRRLRAQHCQATALCVRGGHSHLKCLLWPPTNYSTSHHSLASASMMLAPTRKLDTMEATT